MDPNDWYAAEILVKERLGDLRRTAESLRSRDGRPRPSLRVVVRTTLARLALWLLRPERRPAVPEPDRLNRPLPVGRVGLDPRAATTTSAVGPCPSPEAGCGPSRANRD